MAFKKSCSEFAEATAVSRFDTTLHNGRYISGAYRLLILKKVPAIGAGQTQQLCRFVRDF